ncbi:hypothetical protein CD201_08320 [Hafnia alvei]|uniref:DEAD/DEAH box helicase n=1 Tax=Hafnia alvei TaxID=569 RepID=UPI000DAAD9E7|nr:ATP-binding domain-containing protein [Hafnia alvei]AWV44577.1 hypothetical protein CD201_08320 [Hafnia alvei]
MNLNPSDFPIKHFPELSSVYELLKSSDLILKNAEIYFDFPIYKTDDEKVVATKILLISDIYGVVILHSTLSNEYQRQNIKNDDENLYQAAGHIVSRLLKNKALRKGLTGLKISINSCIYAPNLSSEFINKFDSENLIVNSQKELVNFILNSGEKMEVDLTLEVISTIEGAKGLIKPQDRDEHSFPPDSRVHAVSEAESKILSFDKDQKDGYMLPLDGPQRIRGLAGSGKTVVLSMKAAQTLVRDESKKEKILYTFSTKSLYQHVTRLIHRFYRQFDDDASSLDRVDVLHSWGGRSNPGVYYRACLENDHTPLTLTEAKRLAIRNSMDAFEYACKDLLDNAIKIEPMYDYVFVDEAQDYNKYFIQLCLKLAKNKRIILGADVFQNIFQKRVPSAKEIFEDDTEFLQDKFLNTCYRTPMATLMCAHAIGLGVYSSKHAQKIEKAEYWKELGYEVLGRETGNFEENEEVEVTRSQDRSPSFYELPPESLITYQACSNMSEEVDNVCNLIIKDIKNEGLLPEDILVICADDLRCPKYFNMITIKLSEFRISTNNINADKYNISDFRVSGKVTLSTVHKAKGNEAYSVYFIGVDYLSHGLDVRNRNLIFTGMTRTKAWLHLTGVGNSVSAINTLFSELKSAIEKLPKIKFNYPTIQEAERIEYDIKIKKSGADDELEKEMKRLMERFGADALNSKAAEISAKRDKK